MLSLDIIIIIVLVCFTLLGLMRGLIRQLGSILVFFIALWLAHTFQDNLALYITPSLKDWKFLAQPLAKSIGFFFIFFVGSFLLNLLVRLADKVFNTFTTLGFVKATNRIGGALIGLLEGLLLISVILYVLSFFGPSFVGMQKWMKESKTVPLFAKTVYVVKPLLPDLAMVQKSLEQVQPLLNQADSLQKAGIPLTDPTKIDQATLKKLLEQKK